MSCSIRNLDQMNDRSLHALVLRSLRWDDGAAARSHLEAGRPITYCIDTFDEMIREWPNGIRELITVSDEGTVTVVGCLLPRYLTRPTRPK